MSVDYLKSSKRRSLHRRSNFQRTANIRHNCPKIAMSEKILTCIPIYAPRRPLIVEPGTPDASESEIRFYEIRNTTTSHRCSKLWPSTRQLQRSDATQQGGFKLRVIIARTNLCCDNYCQIQHSRCTKYLFKTLAKHRSNFTPVLEVSTQQRLEQRHTVCRIDIVKYGSFGGLTY